MLSTINLEPFFDQIDQKNWTILPFETSFALDILSMAQQIYSEGSFQSAHTANDHTRTIRNDQTFWLDHNNLIENPVNLKIFKTLDRILSELKSYYRISLDHSECHFAHYQAGNFYKKHSDQSAQNNKRLFSFVIYLNENWLEKNGGRLVGYDLNKIEIFNILPKIGQMIIFKSDIIHEVLLSHRSRWSLTGWFRIA